MDILEILKEAAMSRTPVSFNYIRPEKTRGTRVGNPHAAFISRLNSGEERVYLHLWQTDGASDSGESIPGWRQFFINDLVNVSTLIDVQEFEIAEGYNPGSYEYPIFRI